MSNLHEKDFDEDDDIAVPGDQVDFALVGPVAPHQDLEACLPQEASGLAFATVAEPAVPKSSDDWVHREVAFLGCR